MVFRREAPAQLAEPRVGEIYAVRTFRVSTDDGSLVPIAQSGQFQAWRSGRAEAVCARSRDHVAPDEDCTCGLYAFGSLAELERQYVQTRRVMAVVACHGKVISGTKGVRAQHARVVALWVDPNLPRALIDKVRSRYSQVPMFSDREVMLAEFPVSDLDTYSTGRQPFRSRAVRAAYLIGAVGIGIGVYFGEPMGEPWQVLALVVALASGAMALGASLGMRALGPTIGIGCVGVMAISLGLALRGIAPSVAAVPFLAVVLCYLAVGFSQRVVVRWGPICDGLVAYTPPLPSHLLSVSVEQRKMDLPGAQAWEFADHSDEYPVVAACVGPRGIQGRRSVRRWLRRTTACDVVFLDPMSTGAFMVSRRTRTHARTPFWRTVNRQICSRATVENTLGVSLEDSGRRSRRRLGSEPRRDGTFAGVVRHLRHRRSDS
ncbi:MAG TPA: hypothetical protein VHC49_16045 [Mycobacteriales bacterium]|nr:hypothetical protein [Mycobacteriales bacterium]